MAKEKVTWKKLVLSLQSGSNAQKSSWTEILVSPSEKYMVQVLDETNNQLTKQGMIEDYCIDVLLQNSSLEKLVNDGADVEQLVKFRKEFDKKNGG